METTIIALAIALAAMVLIAVFAVAYCYKLQEKNSRLQKLCDTIQNDFAEYMKAQQNIYDNLIKEYNNGLRKKGEEIAHLKECISEYKKEILQYKNQIEELQFENTILGQQLAECQFKDKENRL